MATFRAVEQERKAAREPGLDLLRTLAILLVALYHMWLQPAPKVLRVVEQCGWMGVDLFFVISGFVIASMIHRERSSTGRFRFGRFYLRRFKRLT